MKLFLVLLFAVAPVYRQALPGYHYEFPRDHFEHPDFRTEWWYYTGNVHAADGHRYGFELVFFRQGERKDETNRSIWRVDDLYLAHLALTDIDGQRFRYHKRLNRAGPGIAGASGDQARVWNGNWEARWNPQSGVQTLQAVAEDIRFTFRLTPRTPPVIHGENGVSQKAEGLGKASHYVSFPLMDVSGTLNGAAVSGSAWMDHEWFTHQLEAGQQGWDWFSAQLDSGAELMLFQLRHPDGTADAFSAGTYIAANGRATHLKSGDFQLQPLAWWKSSTTGGRYPIRWRITVPSLHLELECSAALENQELVAENESTPSYWEGAVSYAGSSRGVGYLEMTGYNRAMKL